MHDTHSHMHTLHIGMVVAWKFLCRDESIAKDSRIEKGG